MRRGEFARGLALKQTYKVQRRLPVWPTVGTLRLRVALVVSAFYSTPAKWEFQS